MILTRYLLFSALFQLNDGGQEKFSKRNDTIPKKGFLSKFMFADVPEFDTEFVYEEVYSPDGIANQLLQNFFNWFCPTVFWFTFLPFYDRLRPIFAPANNQRQFADAPNFNVTEIYQTTFSPEGVLIQMVQNFWNFFISSFFWLTYIPLYERIFPIFDTNVENQGTESKDNNNNNNDQARSNASVNIPTRFARYDINNGNREARSISDLPNKDKAHFSSNDLENGQARYIENHPGKGQDRVGSNDPDNGQAFFADVPQFNATFIYYGVYSPTGVAIQLVQNFFNWFSSTMFWLSYTPFYTRMLPIFSPANNQRSIESVFNPVPYFKYLLYHQEETNDQVDRKLAYNEERGVVTKVKSPFLFIEHLKTFFYGEELVSEGEARFGDPWFFNMTTVYQTTFSPEGIMIQMTQNFFNFFVSTMFWLSFLPFYERLFPIFDMDHNNETSVKENNFSYKFSLDKFEQQYADHATAAPRDFKPSGKTFELSFGRFAKLLRAFANFIEGIKDFLNIGRQGNSNSSNNEKLRDFENCPESDNYCSQGANDRSTNEPDEISNEPRFFGDVPSYNVTTIYTSTFSYNGIMQLQIQNFFNFFTSTMFWLSFIPLYERLYPTFVVSGQNSTDQFNKFHFHDVPNFNVTSIYEETYLSDTVAIQLLQNFFNWFTATVVWFPFMGLYNRLYPIFAPANNQRSIDDQIDEMNVCTDALFHLAEKLVGILRLFADVTDGFQWFVDCF